jgi:hypothetical protein
MDYQLVRTNPEVFELPRLPGRPPTKSSWIWTQFPAETIPGTSWLPPREKEKVPDQMLVCARCTPTWSTKASIIKGSTGNL